MEKAEETLLAGSLIDGKYRVVRPIGTGGMGAVYEAVQVAIDRKVAVKVLHKQYGKNADLIERFHQEARHAASIGHDNICEVTDLGTLSDGIPYLVMPVLKGQPLSDLLAQSTAPLGIGQTTDIICQTLSALHAAHGAGIVHRDMKPENIFITTFGDRESFVKLLDFGISKVVEKETDSHITGAGTVVGTPFYMAPEQARGAKHIDHRLDIYAVGVIFYEALTGQLPFEGDSYNEVMFNIVSENFKPPRKLRPEIPVTLELIILKAMSKNPNDRYNTALEMREKCKSTIGLLTSQGEMALSSEDIPETVTASHAPPPTEAAPLFDSPPASPPSSSSQQETPLETPSIHPFASPKPAPAETMIGVPLWSPTPPRDDSVDQTPEPSDTPREEPKAASPPTPSPSRVTAPTPPARPRAKSAPQKGLRLVSPVPMARVNRRIIGVVAAVLLAAIVVGWAAPRLMSDTKETAPAPDAPPSRTVEAAPASPSKEKVTEEKKKTADKAPRVAAPSGVGPPVKPKEQNKAKQSGITRAKKKPTLEKKQKSKKKPRELTVEDVRVIEVDDGSGKSLVIIKDK
jgi:serine/threonine-protein kinase